METSSTIEWQEEDLYLMFVAAAVATVVLVLWESNKRAKQAQVLEVPDGPKGLPGFGTKPETRKTIEELRTNDPHEEGLRTVTREQLAK